MRHEWSKHLNVLVLTPLVLVFLFAIACGDSAPVAQEKDATADKAVSKEVPGDKPEAVKTEVEKTAVKEVLVVPTTAPVAIGDKPWLEWVKQGKQGGILQMGAWYETDHWDVHQGCCNRTLYIPSNVYNQLVMFNPDDQTTIIGDLADTWEWAPDGSSVTFKLNDARWTDGEPVTADDIVFSLDRMTDLTKIRPRVRNIAPYYKNSEALDPQTIKVNTSFNNPAALLPFMSTGFMVMMPKHVLDGRADAEEFYDTPENIVGSGAFKFVSHERGVGMELERNPDYFKPGLPFLDGVKATIINEKNRHMAAFLTGQIDFTPYMGMNETDSDEFLTKLGNKGKLFYSGANLMRFYEINFRNPPVDDPRVRRALYLATDREAMNRVRRLGRAKLGVPFFPGTQWSSTDEEIATWPGFRYVDAAGNPLTAGPYGVSGFQKDPRDIEEAKALLNEAGYGDGPLRIAYHTTADLKDVALLLKEQLAKVGIDLDLKLTDSTTGFNAEQSGDYEHLLGLGHGPNIIDPDDLFLGVYMPGGPRNALKYEDKRISEIFETQKSEPDLAKRIALIKQAEEILRQGEGHFVNYFWWALPAHTFSNKVKNYNVEPITVQYGFQLEHIWLDK